MVELGDVSVPPRAGRAVGIVVAAPALSGRSLENSGTPSSVRGACLPFS